MGMGNLGVVSGFGSLAVVVSNMFFAQPADASEKGLEGAFMTSGFKEATTACELHSYLGSDDYLNAIDARLSEIKDTIDVAYEEAHKRGYPSESDATPEEREAAQDEMIRSGGLFSGKTLSIYEEGLTQAAAELILMESGVDFSDLQEEKTNLEEQKSNLYALKRYSEAGCDTEQRDPSMNTLDAVKRASNNNKMRLGL